MPTVKFLGIRLPSVIATEIYTRFAPIAKDYLKCISVEKPSNYHFTLKYYGPVELTKKDIGALEKVRDIPKFTLDLVGFGTFRNRVLFVEGEQTQEFDLFVDLLHPDKFAPHLTIARNRSQDLNLKPIIAKLGSVFYSFLVDSVFLFETQHTPEGKKYVPIKEIHLK